MANDYGSLDGSGDVWGAFLTFQALSSPRHAPVWLASLGVGLSPVSTARRGHVLGVIREAEG